MIASVALTSRWAPQQCWPAQPRPKQLGEPLRHQCSRDRRYHFRPDGRRFGQRQAPLHRTLPMVGIPDGLGAFDNYDDTFTVLMNHEIAPASGVPRQHGSPGLLSRTGSSARTTSPSCMAATKRSSCSSGAAQAVALSQPLERWGGYVRPIWLCRQRSITAKAGKGLAAASS